MAKMIFSNYRENFDNQMQKLLEQIILLGSMVEESVLAAVTALQQCNHTAAQMIIENDRAVNEKRYAIEDDCITLIVTQQPMARDARFLISVLEISTELERIGDYAKGIAQITLARGYEPIDTIVFSYIQQMAEVGLRLLSAALDAFNRKDATTARMIPGEDDKVDGLYNAVYQFVATKMIANQTSLDQANYLIWAAHNLERLADRVSNICERTVYLATGEMKELEENRGEI
jgi:phosphate transport system protein